MHGGLSPDLKSMEQIRRVHRPTDVPDTGLLCDLLWADPDKEIQGWCVAALVDFFFPVCVRLSLLLPPFPLLAMCVIRVS